MLPEYCCRTAIQPLNHSVAFLKEKQIILSDDAWRIVINLNISAYEDAIATIRTYTLSIEKQKTEFTPFSELKQVESLLDTLEFKLHDF
jgi:hypothetical protein